MIYVPERYFRLEEEEFTLALTLLYMKAPAMEGTIIHSGAVFYCMFGDKDPEIRLKKDLTSVITNMGFNNVGKGIYVVPNTYFERGEDEHFARVYYEDVQKILRSEYKNKCFLVKYYCWMMKSVNNTSNVGCMPTSYFESCMSCSKSTILRANERLEKLGIIYVRHSSTLKNAEDGSVYAEANVYGNRRDWGVINDYADKMLDKSCVNAKQMGSKIAWLRKGKAYSLEEVQEMYDYAVSNNTAVMTHKKAGKIIDMEVFDGYDVVHDEYYDMFA